MKYRAAMGGHAVFATGKTSRGNTLLVVQALAAREIPAGIGGNVTLTLRLSFSKRRAMNAWRRRPRSHGIFVLHSSAWAIVFVIRRFSDAIVLLLGVIGCRCLLRRLFRC